MAFSNDKLDSKHKQLLENGTIEQGSPAHVVSLKFCSLGYNSLNEMQKRVYNLSVVPHLTAIAERFSFSQHTPEQDE